MCPSGWQLPQEKVPVVEALALKKAIRPRFITGSVGSSSAIVVNPSEEQNSGVGAVREWRLSHAPYKPASTCLFTRKSPFKVPRVVVPDFIFFALRSGLGVVPLKLFDFHERLIDPLPVHLPGTSVA